MEIEERELECEVGQDSCFGKITIIELELNVRETGFMTTVEKGTNSEKTENNSLLQNEKSVKRPILNSSARQSVIKIKS